MKTADTIVADIHAIRREIDKETEGMTPSQVTEYFHQHTEPIIKRFGFIIATTDELRRRSAESTK